MTAVRRTFPSLSQAPDPDGEVVQVAEPLGLRGEAVMEAPVRLSARPCSSANRQARTVPPVARK